MRIVGLLSIVGLMVMQSASAESSWFLGAGGSFTTLDSVNFVKTSGLLDSPGLVNAGGGELRDNAFGWQVFGGYMFSENFGLLVKYSDSGDAEDDWSAFVEIDDDSNAATPPVRTDFNFNGEMSIDGFTIYAVQTVPMPNNFEFSLEAGWTFQDIDFDWAAVGNAGSLSDDDSGFAVGAVVRYKFLEHWAVSGEFEYLAVDFGSIIDEPIRLSINAEYHF
jgi:hypothetical protein